MTDVWYKLPSVTTLEIHSRSRAWKLGMLRHRKREREHQSDRKKVRRCVWGLKRSHCSHKRHHGVSCPSPPAAGPTWKPTHPSDSVKSLPPTESKFCAPFCNLHSTESVLVERQSEMLLRLKRIFPSMRKACSLHTHSHLVWRKPWETLSRVHCAPVSEPTVPKRSPSEAGR